MSIKIGNIPVGHDHEPFICAELGINHNGSLTSAIEMIRSAKNHGATAVKFQKRNLRFSIPEDQKSQKRETPWGVMTYLDYKKRMEFDEKQYFRISQECVRQNLLWFASVWDVPSVDFMSQFDPPAYKIGSATMTNLKVIERILLKNAPIIMSTGMSTMEEIEDAVTFIMEARERLILCHSTSIYPCPEDKLNLRFLTTLAKKWPYLTLGYSGHEKGTGITQAAVALGASYIERHFTLDSTSWGTDQSSSLEPDEFDQMARDCKSVWSAIGDGVKVVYAEEQQKKNMLRVKVHG